ncbi:MAG TPA: copper homeostasis protein CutC [Flavobacteriales bacterium]|jgi:copper homeostasis protein|nr:copper homeostasis protein CutC [Flavobacteriales bacterium]HIB76184.1 copper homeostasis protein CutC [Flavobacteriales bacterium]HIN42047.1 copper homeostasis protein CutC [Flavobacteriales bacterium]HIO15728.1 copper homeostasis protein CutC [Flavobacteriales bacterium]HIO59136.1 copper homeostasis protein CutC [Flavobacteriales bacterium]
MLFEICASTPVDVAVAKEAGADRVELCGHWECGGLTPSMASIRASVNLGLPVRALVRPRAGDFCYNESEKQLILAEALDCLHVGAEMVVLGGLDIEGGVDESLIEMICSKIPSELIVFHRALDLSKDPMESLEILQDFGINSVLSSGAAPAAGLGLGLIRQLSDAGMQVIAGGGVRAEDIVALGEAGVEAVHASCRVKSISEFKDRGSEELFDLSTFPVDLEKAMILCDAVENWAQFDGDE